MSSCTAGQSVLFDVDGTSAAIRGLDACDDFGCSPIPLHPRPTTILVHGCKSSSARFATLREVFDAHGQQAVCYSYNDREKIEKSAARLRLAIRNLDARIHGEPITVLGHSQGGLVARAAMADIGRAPDRPALARSLRLVSISAPYNGITSASHCGFKVVQVLSLGLTAGLCHSITGAKWFEIHPRAEAVVAPPNLVDSVVEHLMVITDERGTCRRQSGDGSCEEDDYVFSVEEQLNPLVAADRRVTVLTIQAGHAAIVGDTDRPPHQLRDVLQDHGVLVPIGPQREARVQALMQQLYGRDRAPGSAT